MNVKTASAHQADTLFEQIRTLAQRLTLSERLRLIRDILTSVPVEDGAYSEPQIEQSQELSEERKAQERQIHLQKIWEERSAWFGLPLNERQIYTGRFVAVHSGDVVDSDMDKGVLYLRTCQRFGDQPVLIISAEQSEDRTIMIRRPSMADQRRKVE